MFWKKKTQNDARDKIILGMVMLQDKNPVDREAFRKDYIENYDEKPGKFSGEDNAFAFNIEKENIAIGHVMVPVPHGDIEGTAKYAYNWETAVEDLKDHQSHLIVTIMHGGHDQIARYRIFTQVICSLLRTTNALGVYQGSQSLLIPQSDFLDEASPMSDDYFPLRLWIYFGFQATSIGNSSYTYGLKAFDKAEMEIIDSSKSLEEIEKFLFNMTHYVLENDVTFQDGQTCGMSADERIAISYTKGKYVDGDSLKLAY